MTDHKKRWRQYVVKYHSLGWKPLLPLKLTIDAKCNKSLFFPKSWNTLVNEIYNSPSPLAVLETYYDNGWTGLSVMLAPAGLILVNVIHPDAFQQMFNSPPDVFACTHSIPCVRSERGFYLLFRKPSRKKVAYTPQPWGEIKPGGVVILPPTRCTTTKWEFEWVFEPVNSKTIPTLPPIFAAKSGKKQRTEKKEKTTNPVQRKIDKEKLLHALQRYYKEGQRNALWVGLAGLFRKLEIPLDDALRLATEICLYFEDDELQSRLATVRRTYTLPATSVAATSWLQNIGVSPYDILQIKKALTG